MISDCLSFSKVVPDYDQRHLVKPGITGIAQVKGYRGKVSSYFDITHRYKLDMFYIQKACFVLDLRIIYQTFLQITGSLNKLSQKEPTIEIQVPAPAPTPLVQNVVGTWYDQLTPGERQSA
jgi:putative colanic acid biosynthesis UDP-glucose lipid carrier transferase